MILLSYDFKMATSVGSNLFIPACLWFFIAPQLWNSGRVCIIHSDEHVGNLEKKIVTFSDSDKVISAELKTTRKRTNSALLSTPNTNKPELYRHKCSYLIKGEALLTIGYTNFSHVTIVFIAKYLFTGSVKILNKMVFIIAIKFISMRIPEISYCLYSEKFK